MKTIIKLKPILCFFFGTAQTDNILRIEYNDLSLQPIGLDPGVRVWLFEVDWYHDHFYLLKTITDNDLS